MEDFKWHEGSTPDLIIVQHEDGRSVLRAENDIDGEYYILLTGPEVHEDILWELQGDRARFIDCWMYGLNPQQSAWRYSNTPL
jgi:hypothetical protein